MQNLRDTSRPLQRLDSDQSGSQVLTFLRQFDAGGAIGPVISMRIADNAPNGSEGRWRAVGVTTAEAWFTCLVGTVRDAQSNSFQVRQVGHWPMLRF